MAPVPLPAISRNRVKLHRQQRFSLPQPPQRQQSEVERSFDRDSRQHALIRGGTTAPAPRHYRPLSGLPANDGTKLQLRFSSQPACWRTLLLLLQVGEVRVLFQPACGKRGGSAGGRPPSGQYRGSLHRSGHDEAARRTQHQTQAQRRLAHLRAHPPAPIAAPCGMATHQHRHGLLLLTEKPRQIQVVIR